ncbi:hypothetical protein ACI6QG_12210 [Roseococcus sp. DSY-14]|uniref:hypothetical protein n=1 Tax=Roseococcus sp. DSY-14 TaxID=3369650 RepID=UPI00387AEFEE
MILPALAEAWLPLFLLLAGLGLGAALALALGRLLEEHWLAPLHPGLAALARGALPAALLLALPLPALAPLLWPAGTGWGAPAALGARSLLLLALWCGIGWWLAAPGGGRWRGGAALLLLLPTGALAMEDWALARDPAWSGSVQGVALVTEQAAAALGLATLAALRRRAAPGGAEARTGLERALLALALGVLWLWFTQYVVVYAADIPAEAAWYLRREQAPWIWLKLGVALPALGGAIALALVPQWRDWRLGAVAALLVLHHAAHLLWVVRPEAPAGAASPWADAAALALAGLALAALGWRATAGGRSAPAEAPGR